MGQIIHSRTVSNLECAGLLKPIIYCCPDKATTDSAESLNRALAEKLSLVKPNRRTMRLANCFEEILKTLPDNTVIKDFDVMFNPDYKVDVLKILVDACKRKPFSAIWPGKYEDGRLCYAEDGYSDYKIFNIAEYDITCVV